MLLEYSEAVKMLMRLHYGSLREKERRQYAAVEARKPGYGGVTYISRLLPVGRKTIGEGKKELQALTATTMASTGRQRRALVAVGKKKTALLPIESLLTALTESLRAGSPTNEKTDWVSLRPRQIAGRFCQQHGIRIRHVG